MEPVKGGNLVKLPADAQKAFDDVNQAENTHMSNASYAIRYAAGNENVAVVLSGMSNMEQMRDNVSQQNHCPANIMIPEVLACLNSKNIFNDFISSYCYNNSLTVGEHSKASACIACGGCEHVCPQKLPIIKLLKDAAKEFETTEEN